MVDQGAFEHLATMVEATATQDLSAGPLSFTTSFGTDFRLVGVFFHMTGAVSQTITVTLDALAGAGFDTVIGKKTLSSNTDAQFVPAASLQDFLGGNEVKIEMTDSGSPAVTVSIIVVAVKQ